MSFEHGLYTRLSDDSEMVAMVGDRIWPVSVPQRSAYPHVVFRKQSGAHDYGLWDAPVMHSPIMEFVCFGSSYEQVRGVADRVIVLLDRHRGDMGGAQLASSLKLNEVEDDVDMETEKVYRVRLWFEMTYQG